MPEMSYPISDSDQDQLLFDAPTRGIWREWICKRKTIFVLISVFTVLAILCTIVLSLTLPKAAVIVPTTLAPPTTTSIPSTTSTPTNITTTTTPSTTPTTTPTTPTTPKTSPTTSPTTTTTTTTKTPTTTIITVPTTETTTTVDPKTTTTFHPTTFKPLPANVTAYPPISLLIDMGMRPNFTLIPCKLHLKPTYKFTVTVLDTYTYIGEDQDRKEDAKTSSARVANEALFGIHYPTPMPRNATYPCLV